MSTKERRYKYGLVNLSTEVPIELRDSAAEVARTNGTTISNLIRERLEELVANAAKKGKTKRRPTA